jgi:hypothetical protein
MRFLGLMKLFGLRRTLLGWVALVLIRRWLRRREQRGSAQAA